ncbi:MAG TPA: Gfo/Idh/MocA family oxidoreductase [Fimbriiglobus sp.]|nr:Gfo/Idh/MocA family oxidoreductase [Fimbriiglobus sp.]
MTTPFRLAFVGVDHPHGSGWRDLLPALGDVELTALVPGFGGALTSLEERSARLPRFDSVDDLIARGTFDGAIVCLPNRETPDAVAELARAGKHVLVEKPGAATEADFAPAAEAVRKAGVAFQTGYLWRYDPGAERLREMVRDGRFGQLISAEAGLFTSDVSRRGPTHYLFDPDQSGGGFFNWLMCHWFDLLLFLFERPVVGVTARVGRFGTTPVDVDDGGTAILELEGGSLATLTGGYWLPRWVTELRWTVHGSARWVHWDPLVPGTGGVLTLRGPQPHALATDEKFVLPVDQTPGYCGERGVHLIRDWVESARTGRTVCRNTVDSTLASLRLLDLVCQSSNEGRRVECDVRSATLPAWTSPS